MNTPVSSQNAAEMAVRRPLPVRAFMAVLAVVVQLYTWLSLPVFVLAQRPWRRLALHRKRRFVTLPAGERHALPDREEERLCSMVYERADEAFERHPVLHLESITDMLDKVVSAHGPNALTLGEFYFRFRLLFNCLAFSLVELSRQELFSFFFFVL